MLMLKYRKLIIFLTCVSLIGAGCLIFYKIHHKDPLPSNLYKQFTCDRVIQNALATDVYCNDYDLYKKDHAAGKI